MRAIFHGLLSYGNLRVKAEPDLSHNHQLLTVDLHNCLLVGSNPDASHALSW